MKELDIQAVKENIYEVTDFIGAVLDEINCGLKPKIQIETVVEEIFVNISSYAYAPDTGNVTIRIETQREPLAVIMSFTDSGKPYDPVAGPEPDLTIPINERGNGGLGIVMVKSAMDSVSYEYRDGHNVLTVRKNIE